MINPFRKICACILLGVTALSYIIAMIITVNWSDSYQVCCFTEALCLFIIAYNCGILSSYLDTRGFLKSPDDQTALEEV